ncbi:hypothetical protein Tco_0474165 [Tanacetum coccineum]
MVVQNQSEFGEDEVVHKELGDNLVRAATTASSLEAEQDNGAKKPWGILLLKLSLRVYLNIPMIHCSQEKINTTQHNEIVSLKRKVKKLEKKDRSRTHKLKRLYKVGLTARVESSGDEESLGEDASKQGRIDAIDADEEITLVSVQNIDEEMFDVNVLNGEEMFVADKQVYDEVNVVEEAVKVINTAKLIIDAAQVSAVGDIVSTASASTTTIDDVDDITLAQALTEMKSTKPKNKGDKGKGILIEPVKPMKKKDLIRLDKEVALKLQAEFDEEERLARDKAEKEANSALIETWDDIQEKIDNDHQLAKRLQAQEQEELFVE